MMYDAYGAQVAIATAGYRHISYIYPTASNTTAKEISLDPQIVTGGLEQFFQRALLGRDGSQQCQYDHVQLGSRSASEFWFRC